MRPSSIESLGPRLRCVGAALALGMAGSPWAQTIEIRPQFGVRTIYTDNVALAAPGKEASEFIVDLMPRIAVRYKGGRLKAEADYTLHALNYLNGTAGSRTANALLAKASLEAVDNQLFVDGAASISTVGISAFGAQPVDVAHRSANQTELRTASLSPYFRGVLPSIHAGYDLRYTRLTSRTDGATLASSDTNQYQAQIKDTSGRRIGWSADYSRSDQQFSNRPDIRRENARGILSFTIDPQARVYGVVGHEAGTLGLTTSEYSRNYAGAGFTWQPTPRTQISGEQTQRHFGTGFNYRLTHRTALTAWEAGFTRDATTLQEQLFQAGPGDVYALLYNNYAGRIPDPDERDRAIRQFLQTTGMARILTQQVNFLTNRVFLQRRLYGSAALVGKTNTLTFAASSSVRDALDTGVPLVDDFLVSPRLRTRSLSANWNHRFTPLTALDLMLMDLRNSGDNGLFRHQELATLTLNTKLGPNTNGNVGLRTVRLSSNLSSYREHAVFAMLNTAF